MNRLDFGIAIIFQKIFLYLSFTWESQIISWASKSLFAHRPCKFISHSALKKIKNSPINNKCVMSGSTL